MYKYLVSIKLSISINILFFSFIDREVQDYDAMVRQILSIPYF